MLNEIADELVKVLQESVPPDVPEENIGRAKKKTKPEPSSSEASAAKRLPAISVCSSDFTFRDAGVGGGGTDVKEKTEEQLSGDGKTKTFTLSERPLRPLIRVESPIGAEMHEKDDFVVDYAKNAIAFSSPPPKGKNAILVQYYSAKTSGDSKFVQMNITYNVDVWAADEKERDDITVDVIKAIALAEESLSSRGMRIRPIQGSNLEDGPLDGEVSVKRLTYSVEVDLQVEKTPVPRIERIEIEQKEQLNS
jgi:hypothetical protein